MKDKIKEMEKIIDTKLKKIEEKKGLNSYKYTMLRKEDNNYIIDKNYSNKYGTNRKGYEEWKNNNKDKTVEYAGIVSFRKIYDKNNNEIGAFLEEKITEQIDTEKEIKNMLETFYKLFDVKDKKNMLYYIETELEKYISLPGLDYIESYALCLKNIIKNMEDKEYQIFFNKIKS